MTFVQSIATAVRPSAGAASKVGDGLVEIGGHGAPALEEGIGLGGRADRLVGGDVQQVDLRPVHRVDVEGGDVGVEDGAVDPQRVGEGGARRRVPLVANVGQLELEPVEERAPRLVRLARVVLEPVVEASVAERRGEGRVATEDRLPVRVGEAVEGGRCGCGGHAVMLATARGHWMTPMNSIVAIIRSRTARLRSKSPPISARRPRDEVRTLLECRPELDDVLVDRHHRCRPP